MSGLLGKSNLGGGGGGLNLTVETHASAPASAQSGRENEIWVVSNTPCRYWAVKATDPVASDFNEDEIPVGAVWVKNEDADMACHISRNSKKAVILTSETCFQFVNGKWESLDAYMYRNGLWIWFAKAFNGVLWDDGLQNVDQTGGVVKGGSGSVYNPEYNYYDVTCIRLEASMGTIIWFNFVNKIDVTNFSTLYVELAANTSNGTYIIVARDTSWSTTGVPSSAVANLYTKNNGVFSVDISNLSGSFYIGCKNHYNTGAIYIKIWLR